MSVWNRILRGVFLMIIDRKKVGNKQIRGYEIKLTKKTFEEVKNDIFDNFNINKTITINISG